MSPWLRRTLEDELQAVLRAGTDLPNARFTVAVHRMRDSTPERFDDESLRNSIMAPFGRSFGTFISVCFLFLGYFVEVFLPRVPKAYAQRHGVLHANSSIFLAPFVEVLHIPEITVILARGLHKEHAGPSKVS